MRTRSVIERSFGLLKSRFRCLDKSGGTLLYAPEKVLKIVVACIVLHNFCTRNNLAAPVNEDYAQEHEAVAISENDLSAVELRRHLVLHSF